MRVKDQGRLNVLLISTYELGHQPFGLASPTAWLAREGHAVRAIDLAVERDQNALSDAAIRGAEFVAFYLPMHTATRLALPVIARVKRLNPDARIICYGIYAPLNADLLRSLGVEAVLGGEFEAGLVRLARGESVGEITLERLEFIAPDRGDLRALDDYARLRFADAGRSGESRPAGESKLVAYTEASRGCKHLCRHCPVVPVYQGHFRVVQSEIVLADIRQQIARGATHVTFGDPDFFNGPTHAIKIVTALHAEFPAVTYDATIKIEHLLKHREALAILRDTGCLFLTSAVESLDDAVLRKLEKNHTRRDFYEAANLTRAAGIALQPTFIAFTPWTTIEGYRDLLRALAELDLIENVAPVQFALRLLITSGSRLLELDEIRSCAGQFDPKSLTFPWAHADPEVDRLAARVFRMVAERQKEGRSRGEIFREICEMAGVAVDIQEPAENYKLMPRAAIPYLDEPWYC